MGRAAMAAAFGLAAVRTWSTAAATEISANPMRTQRETFSVMPLAAAGFRKLILIKAFTSRPTSPRRSFDKPTCGRQDANGVGRARLRPYFVPVVRQKSRRPRKSLKNRQQTTSRDVAGQFAHARYGGNRRTVEISF
jgi:hypothetical protein